MRLADAVRDVRNALSDPTGVMASLGLQKGSKRQAGGVMVCCPVHGERNASMSITRGPDGTVRVKCFGCDFAGDVIGLVAAVRGLSTRGEQFREALSETAALAGLHDLSESLRTDVLRNPVRVAAPAALPEKPYPDRDEVEQLWLEASSVAWDRECSGLLVGRRIDPVEVEAQDLARRIGPELPDWAQYHGQSWEATGHRMLLRSFDDRGQFRSVRAWRVVDGDSPKRLPPAGRKGSGLVQANALAVSMLNQKSCPVSLVVVEGEPDFLTASTVWHRDAAVIGIGSGSWTTGFGLAVPRGTKVTIATHNDPAGERYAEQVLSTLNGRQVWRWRNNNG